MDMIPVFLPASVWCVLSPFWAALLDWFNAWVYNRLLQGLQEELLVQLQSRLDLGAVEEACAGYHHAAGCGAPASHPVARLVRALLVGHLYDWSTRELERQMRTNFLVRWFVGCRLWEAVPDHSTLDRFAVWVSQHQARSYFDSVLAQIDADQADQPNATQIGDTFAMRADADRKTLVPLLRDTCHRVLRTFQRLAGAAYSEIQAHIDNVALFGPPDELNAHYLDDAGRLARTLTTAREAATCAAHLQRYLAAANDLAAKPRQVLERELAVLSKLLTDEFQITCTQPGQVATVTRLAKKQRGTFRMGSARDPEASYRVHGSREGQTTLGYNVSLAVTDHFVREIRAASGAQPDRDGVPGLLSAQRVHHQVQPTKLIYDAAAGNAKTYARVAAASGGQTQLVAPLLPASSHKGYGPEDFDLSADGTTLTCPNGQTTQRASPSREGRLFRFDRQPCLSCALWSACRGTVAPTNEATAGEPGAALPIASLDSAMLLPDAAAATPATVKTPRVVTRQVFISDYYVYARQARAYRQTEQYKADRKHRTVVERIIAALTRYNGARRCRRLGLGHADFQAKMAAVAYNLKKWLRLSTLREQAARQAAA